jgi:RimJ/RimL family protein N-acetyltransferase
MDERLASISLGSGSEAKVSFLSKKDSTKELLDFINSAIKEKTYILYEKEFTLLQERKWKKNELQKMKDNEGFILIARMDGKIAGITEATRDLGRSKNNIQMGIIISKEFRGMGLGESLLRLNIKQTRKRLRPKNIYLSVYSPNKSAISLYKKIGFKRFALFPQWAKFGNKYVDQIFMKLEK